MAKVEIRGLKGVTDALKKHPELINRAIEVELFKQGNIIMTQAKELTPVDTGALRSSGFVEAAKRMGKRIVVTMGFGGTAQRYALFVHEDLNARHNPPTQAKFLETPARAAKKRIRLGVIGAVRKAIKAVNG